MFEYGPSFSSTNIEPARIKRGGYRTARIKKGGGGTGGPDSP